MALFLLAMGTVLVAGFEPENRPCGMFLFWEVTYVTDIVRQKYYYILKAKEVVDIK